MFKPIEDLILKRKGEFVEKKSAPAVPDKERILNIWLDDQTPYVYGLGVSGTVYKLHRYEGGEWKILVENPVKNESS